ncbi:MAG TPA: zf-HC2 domain-containing protein, partial [Acidimicrobiales bacterium]
MRPDMTCDDAAAALSAAADGEPVDAATRGALDDHLRTCGRCASFARHVTDLRAALRLEAVDAAPDIAGPVGAVLGAQTRAPAGGSGDAGPPARGTAAHGTAAHGTPGDHTPGDRPRRPAGRGTARGTARRPVLVAAAAALLAGTVAGATAVGFGTEPRSPAAADVPSRVIEAQHDITSLDARITVAEHGLRGLDGLRGRPG